MQSNAYTNEAPLMRGEPGLYTSVLWAFYQHGSLRVRVCIYNRTGAPIVGSDGFVFEFMEDEQVLCRYPVGQVAFDEPLKHKGCRVIELCLRENALRGVKKCIYDLTSRRYRARITGIYDGVREVFALEPEMDGVECAKGYQVFRPPLRDVIAPAIYILP